MFERFSPATLEIISNALGAEAILEATEELSTKALLFSLWSHCEFVRQILQSLGLRDDILRRNIAEAAVPETPLQFSIIVNGFKGHPMFKDQFTAALESGLPNRGGNIRDVWLLVAIQLHDAAIRATFMLAHSEARSLGGLAIEPEHLLLGMLREPNGLAGRVLDVSSIHYEDVLAQVILTKDLPSFPVDQG